MSEILPAYFDPVLNDNVPALAAFCPVWISGRAASDESGGEQEYIDTGWIVVVKERLGSE